MSIHRSFGVPWNLEQSITYSPVLTQGSRGTGSDYRGGAGWCEE